MALVPLGTGGGQFQVSAVGVVDDADVALIAEAGEPILKEAGDLLFEEDFLDAGGDVVEGWNGFVVFVEGGDEGFFVIGGDLVGGNADAAAETEIDEAEDGHALAPALVDHLVGEVIGAEKGVPAMFGAAMEFFAFRDGFGEFGDGFMDFGSGSVDGLLLFFHLLEDEGAVDEAAEGVGGGVLAREHLKGLEGG